jgi:hypothetical protein
MSFQYAGWLGPQRPGSRAPHHQYLSLTRSLCSKQTIRWYLFKANSVFCPLAQISRFKFCKSKFQGTYMCAYVCVPKCSVLSSFFSLEHTHARRQPVTSVDIFCVRWKVSPSSSSAGSILLCNLISELGLSGVRSARARERERHRTLAGWGGEFYTMCVCGKGTCCCCRAPGGSDRQWGQ